MTYTVSSGTLNSTIYTIPYHTICRPTEGRRLSWPRHCRKGAHSSCPRLWITVAFAINTTAHSAIRSRDLEHCSQTPLDHCDLHTTFQACKALLRIVKRRYIKYNAFLHYKLYSFWFGLDLGLGLDAMMVMVVALLTSLVISCAQFPVSSNRFMKFSAIVFQILAGNSFIFIFIYFLSP